MTVSVAFGQGQRTTGVYCTSLISSRFRSVILKLSGVQHLTLYLHFVTSQKNKTKNLRCVVLSVIIMSWVKTDWCLGEVCSAFASTHKPCKSVSWWSLFSFCLYPQTMHLVPWWSLLSFCLHPQSKVCEICVAFQQAKTLLHVQMLYASCSASLSVLLRDVW